MNKKAKLQADLLKFAINQIRGHIIKKDATILGYCALLIDSLEIRPDGTIILQYWTQNNAEQWEATRTIDAAIKSIRG